MLILTDEAQAPRQWALAGWCQDDEAMIEMLEAGRLPHCARQTLQQPGVHAAHGNVDQCRDCPGQHAADFEAMRARLDYGDHEVGILHVCLGETGEVGAKELALFEGLAVDVAGALRQRELRETAQQSAQVSEASEQKYRHLFRSAVEGMAVADVATRQFVDVNPAFCKMLGYTEDELLKLSVADIHPQEALDYVVGEFMALASGDQKLTANIPCLRKDGTIIHADARGSPMHLDGRDFLVGSFTDASERRQLEARLTQADRLASVGLLASGVAHEINNPLTYVIYNLESILEELPLLWEAARRCAELASCEGVAEIDEDTRELLTSEHLEELQALGRSSLDGAHRISEIVRDLRTFSSTDDGRRGPVEVNRLIEGALTLTASEIKYRARVDRQLGVVPDIIGSEEQLSQVFLQLLVNACQAIKEGDASANFIRISTEVDDGHVVVSVSDSGAGIRAEHLDKLFDPFFTTKDERLGTGLGLSVCHNIVRSHSGTIEVRSEPGCGASFVVRLPMSVSEVPLSTPSKRQPTSSGRNRRGRVLIIDDDPMLGVVLKRALKEHHDVTVIHSGAGAQELLRQDDEFDVLLCDLMMPEVTGMSLFAWLEEHLPQLCSRVIFMSGGAFTSDASALLRRVPNPQLSKPFDRSKLRALVAALVDSRPPTSD